MNRGDAKVSAKDLAEAVVADLQAKGYTKDEIKGMFAAIQPVKKPEGVNGVD